MWLGGRGVYWVDLIVFTDTKQLVHISKKEAVFWINVIVYCFYGDIIFNKIPVTTLLIDAG